MSDGLLTTTFDMGERRGWGLRQSEQLLAGLIKVFKRNNSITVLRSFNKISLCQKKKYKLKFELILIFKKWLILCVRTC